MAWKKLAYLDEVASLSDATPQAVDGSAASAGTGTAAARDDHVHALGPLVANLNCNQKQMDGMVLEATTTVPDNGSEAEGQVYYNSRTTDQHIYVWVP